MSLSFAPTNFHLSGTLDQVPIEQVFQLVSATRATGMLELAFEGFSAQVWFAGGVVVAADYAGMEDQDAVNAFITRRSGIFEFFPDEKPLARRMEASVQSLLMEAFRVNDEHPDGEADAAPGDGKGIALVNNTVRVTKPLAGPLEMEFDIACRGLLDSRARILVVDLTRVKLIISQYLSSLALVAVEARRLGRRLIVRASRTVSQVLYRMRFNELMEIETKMETGEIPWSD